MVCLSETHLEFTGKTKLAAALAMAAAVLLIYGRTLAGDFVFDDRYIAQSGDFLRLNNLTEVIASPYWSQASGLYRPITLASYAFNYSLSGAEPWSFHLINLALYAWSCYLIFLLLTRLTQNQALAILAAAIFLVLPIHSEAVANIIGRAEILALFFSLIFFLEITKEKPKPWLAGLWIFLALGSKEIAAAAIPLGLVLYLQGNPALEKGRLLTKETYLFQGRGWLPISAGAMLYFGARLQVLGWNYFSSLETSMVENPLKFEPFLSRAATAFKVMAMYVQKTFWPVNLCSDYSYNQIPVLKNFWNPSSLAGLAIFLAALAAIVFFWKRAPSHPTRWEGAPIISWSAAVFVFSFLIVSNIFFTTGTIAGERLAYYPSLGLIIIVAYLLTRPMRTASRPAKIAISILILVTVGFYGWKSYTRSLDWLTEKRLFESAARCAPASVLSRSNLGAAYYQEGNLAQAKAELLAAEKIYNGYPKGLNNLGLVYWKEGERKKAREYFLKALNFKFPYIGAYENLALMALEENNLAEAKKWLLLFYSGDTLAAEAYLQRSLKLSR